MENNANQKNPSRVRKILNVVPFLLGLPFVKISSQAWIVSVILLIVVFLIVLVSERSEKITVLGVIDGSYSKVLTGTLSFCLGAVLVTVYETVSERIREGREQEIKQELFSQHFSDMENIVLAREYFKKAKVAPSLGEIKKMQFPARLQQTTLGYCLYNVGRYTEAKETFEAVTPENPISNYYLGLMTYNGMGDVPHPEKGLSLIRSAAREQELNAMLFLFYHAVRDDNLPEAEMYAKDILFKRPSSVGVFSKEFLSSSYVGYAPTLLHNQYDVFNLMNDYYLRIGKTEEGLALVDRFCSVLKQGESTDYFRAVWTINYYEASGNAHQVKRLIRKGIKENNNYCLLLGAENLLGMENPNDPIKEGISESDFVRAESYLRRAIVKNSETAKRILDAAYLSRGDTLKYIEADHVYSLVKMLSDEKQ